MTEFLTTILAGITAFIATNIDDLVILILFFSQRHLFQPQQIIFGQYLGFIALIIVSLPGFFGGLLIPKTWIGFLGFVPLTMGILVWLKKEEDGDEIQGVSEEIYVTKTGSIWAKLTQLIDPKIWQVGAVTFANGGDNIGIYVSLFARSNFINLVIILILFLILVFIWCYTAYLLAKHPRIADVLTHRSQIIVPWVFMGLGLLILIENKTYQLFLPN